MTDMFDRWYETLGVIFLQAPEMWRVSGRHMA